jgi:hypothetical protein
MPSNVSPSRIVSIGLLALLVGALFLFLGSGCAHNPVPRCPTAREVMANREGIKEVLGCYHEEKGFERTTRCMVVYEGETRAVSRRVWANHCGL